MPLAEEILCGTRDGTARESTGEAIRILPANSRSSGTESQQLLSVVAVSGDRIAASDRCWLSCEIESSDPSVARIDGGVVRPVGNGSATIVARLADGREATAEGRSDRRRAGTSLELSQRSAKRLLQRLAATPVPVTARWLGKGGFRLSLQRLQPRRRFPDDHARSPRSSRRNGRSRKESDPDQAERRLAAQGRSQARSRNRPTIASSPNGLPPAPKGRVRTIRGWSGSA